MKLLTLNTHSLQEDGYQEKLAQFTAAIIEEKPDILALQEVNQSVGAPPADTALLSDLFLCRGSHVPVREDNHALQVAVRLRRAGISCSWTWLPAKLGYGRYDEGMAMFCLGQKIEEEESFFISGCREYDNWKTRKALGIRGSKQSGWFYTVHMGWWEDEEEPFAVQWERMEQRFSHRKGDGILWLMGDFNSPACIRGQGYDCIRAAGWQDTYELAAQRDGGMTVYGAIDGWRRQEPGGQVPPAMRIDHIWCSASVPVRSSRVIFNGINGPRVSDHCGVLVEI